MDHARPAAKVIVNARSGTIVIGGDVRVTPAVVTHGSLTVKVKEDKQVIKDDPTVTTTEAGATVIPGGETTVDDTTLEVEEETARAFVFDTGVELSDIVDAINAVGAGASDLVEILTALREAGALRAEIIII